jgi:hypothetical protein
MVTNKGLPRVPGLGAGFAELGESFADILQRFQDTRQKQEEKLRHLKAVVDLSVIIKLYSSKPSTSTRGRGVLEFIAYLTWL